MDIHKEAVSALFAGGVVGIKETDSDEFLDFIETRLGVPPGDDRALTVFNEAQQKATQEEAIAGLQKFVNEVARHKSGRR